VRRIVKQLLDDGIIISVPREDIADGYVTFQLSNDYIEKETLDFSLDESFKFGDRVITDDMCKDAIIEATWKLNAPFPADVAFEAFIKLKTDGQDIHYDNGGYLYEFIWKRLQRMIDDGTIAYDGANGCTISTAYLERETSGFSLDESLRHIIQKIILGA
jgi:hypothetical protein